MVPIMKTTNAKSVRSDFTHPVGDPPPVVDPEDKSPELKILLSLLKKANMQQIRAIIKYAEHVIEF